MVEKPCGWTVGRSYRSGDSNVVLKCPDMRRHTLSDEQAMALAEELLEQARC